MTTIDLRTLKIRSGEQYRGSRKVELEPLQLGGQTYGPVADRVDAELVITRTSSGLLFELDFESRLEGPCFRCLAAAGITTTVRAREYQASGPAREDDLRTPYVNDDRLDLTTWARDAVALALPDKILCHADCAGLCPECGRDLNAQPHEHAEDVADPRWAALAELRDRL